MQTNVLEYLQESAKQNPDHMAVIDEKDAITYTDLIKSAREIGSALDPLKGPEDPRQESVVIFIDKSIACLKAMLGTIWSGNFYVVMDVKTPIDRFQSIIKTLDNRILITVPELFETVKHFGYSGKIYLIGDLEETGKLSQPCETWRQRIDSDLIYVLFTSGSTGVPKGVAISHRSVIDYVDAFVSELGVESEDILGNQSPFYFDVSLKDIYMAQKAGATVCIIPQRYFMTPKKLLEFMEEKQVTAISWVPTAYRMVAQFKGLQKIRPSSLKRFVFSGETMPAGVYKYWKESYPDGIFFQQYGPTEITGACTNYRVTREFSDEETIPIGKAFPNTDLFLIDEKGRYIPPSSRDQIGEIYVRGTCVSPGYYNNPERTAEQFVQNPLQNSYPETVYRTGDLAYWNGLGELIFVSRKDLQIKHSGHRIELGEIEKAILSVKGIDGCCCVQNRKKDEIVCFYVGPLSDKREILLQVRQKLVKYMIPSVWEHLEELPVLPNGKLDRKKLDRRVNEGSK